MLPNPWHLGYAWSNDCVNTTRVYDKLSSIEDDDRLAITHRNPKYIQVSSLALRDQFAGKREFELDLFDALIRAVRQQDDPRWIGWMLNLLSSSKSAVLVNGYQGPWINCKRGLRQGDPLSPYLFILVAETLQRLIRQEVDIKHPTDESLPCAVLQYADDTLIVFKADTVGAARLKTILDQFAALSGLHVNYGKSTLVPIHASDSVVDQCVQIIGCNKGSFP